jgi:hypothetical protein
VATVEVRVHPDYDPEQVFRWRVEQLERAGYRPQLARRLARCNTVDLHLATQLVQNGCDPETAARILL